MVGILLELELYIGPDPGLEFPIASLLLAWPALELAEYTGAEVINAGVREFDCAPDVKIVDNEEYPTLLVHEPDGETELAEVDDAVTVDDACWEDVEGCVDDGGCVGCVEDVDTMVDTGCEED